MWVDGPHFSVATAHVNRRLADHLASLVPMKGARARDVHDLQLCGVWIVEGSDHEKTHTYGFYALSGLIATSASAQLIRFDPASGVEHVELRSAEGFYGGAAADGRHCTHFRGTDEESEGTFYDSFDFFRYNTASGSNDRNAFVVPNWKALMVSDVSWSFGPDDTLNLPGRLSYHLELMSGVPGRLSAEQGGRADDAHHHDGS